MSNEELDSIKAEIQKILDKHLEKNQRFSIKYLDEESIFILINLLLEKDDLEREHIRAQIQEKIANNKISIELTNEKILEIKKNLDSQKNEINDLNDLKEMIKTDAELDNKLKNNL